jgi:hypothetical protein
MTISSSVKDLRLVAEVTWWERFFWFVGGFDAGILAEPQCRALRSKYSSIGALVLLTGLLASCSGGYAIYTVFRDVQATWIMGSLWGLMILTLDRFLVSSARKIALIKDFNIDPKALPPYTQKSSWLTLAVRLPLAVMIGLVVSAPIEARLMQPLINNYERARNEARTHDIEENSNVKTLKTEIAELNTEIWKKSGEEKDMDGHWVKEVNGEEGKKKGDGPIAKLKDTRRKELKGDREKLERRREEKEENLSNERTRLSGAVSRDSDARARDRSVISDIVTMREIEATPGPVGKAAWTIATFLTLLFVLIECIPVLAKAMSPFDAYDATLQEIEHSGILDSLVEVRRKYAEASLSG